RGSVRRCSRPPSSPIVLPLSRHEKSFRPPWEEARLAPTLISQERILQELAPHGRNGPPVAGFHRACPSTTLDKSGNTTLCNCCAFGSHAITAPRGCQCCLSRISPAPGAGAAPVKRRWNAGGAPMERRCRAGAAPVERRWGAPAEAQGAGGGAGPGEGGAGPGEHSRSAGARPARAGGGPPCRRRRSLIRSEQRREAHFSEGDSTS